MRQAINGAWCSFKKQEGTALAVGIRGEKNKGHKNLSLHSPVSALEHGGREQEQPQFFTSSDRELHPERDRDENAGTSCKK